MRTLKTLGKASVCVRGKEGTNLDDELNSELLNLNAVTPIKIESIMPVGGAAGAYEHSQHFWVELCALVAKNGL